jgi:hypothetical protein
MSEPGRIDARYPRVLEESGGNSCRTVTDTEGPGIHLEVLWKPSETACKRNDVKIRMRG